MPEFAVDAIVETASASVWDVHCRGSCRERSEPERTTVTHIVFPYRGAYVRHVGASHEIAEANQVLFFNAGEDYRVSHPVAGGDASLTMVLDDPVLHELVPPVLLRRSPVPAFRAQRLRIEPHVQTMVAQLRHGARRQDALRAESLTLALVRGALAPYGTVREVKGHARKRLVDRAKLVVAADPARRWTLAQIASEVGASPVYLTQAFQEVEGVPLYRYQMRVRLARALDLLAEHDDLTALGLELGFSSHSHFSAAFRQTYGTSPSAFRRSAPR